MSESIAPECQRNQRVKISGRDTISLIALTEQDCHIRARLRAEAPHVGIRIWLEVKFTAPANTGRAEWMEEAYDCALSVLDPA